MTSDPIAMVTDALSAGDVSAMSTATLDSAKDVRFTGFPFFYVRPSACVQMAHLQPFCPLALIKMISQQGSNGNGLQGSLIFEYVIAKYKQYTFMIYDYAIS